MAAVEWRCDMHAHGDDVDVASQTFPKRMKLFSALGQVQWLAHFCGFKSRGFVRCEAENCIFGRGVTRNTKLRRQANTSTPLSRTMCYIKTSCLVDAVLLEDVGAWCGSRKRRRGLARAEVVRTGSCAMLSTSNKFKRKNELWIRYTHSNVNDISHSVDAASIQSRNVQSRSLAGLTR